MSTQTGPVKWFDNAKGFGFISPGNGSKDLFAHVRDIQANGFKSLSEDQRVMHALGNGPKGEKAIKGYGQA